VFRFVSTVLIKRKAALVGFNLVCGCAYVRTYVYGEGKRESKLHILCSYLSIRLIMFDDQSGPD